MATDHKLLEHNLEYIRTTYGVPARIGGRITYTGGSPTPQKGTILGAENGKLRIKLDGSISGVFHPTWMLTYDEKEANNG